MNIAKWILLAFFAIGVAMQVTEAVKDHRWGTKKTRNEALVSAGVLAGLAVLVVAA